MPNITLVAYLINATSLEHAEIVVTTAEQSINGEWRTCDGDRVTPFWQQEISIPELTIPDGWIEHLHKLADVYAATHRSEPSPTESRKAGAALLASLGFKINKSAVVKGTLRRI
jgi:hypothetical protein